MARPLPENTGNGRGGVAGYKSLTVPPVLLTLPLPSSLPFSPLSITCIFVTQIHFSPPMAKSDSKKRAELMAKEWKKSRSTTKSLGDLVDMGLLHSSELGGWRAPEGESFPDPRAGEIVVFEDFVKRGFGVPVHPFLQGLLLYYEIGICNLHPNSILLISTFIHLCEAYVGIEPHFDLFRYLFCLRKKGAVGGSKVAGGVYLNLRDGMKNHYLHCPWNTSLTEWYRKWFYVREEPGSSTFCDVGYIPEKRVSWTDRPEFDGQVADLMKLIDWSRLDGLGVVGNFICRRVMPCQKRVHSAYEYAGSVDPTRMRPEILEKAEVQRLLNELFNFADGGFIRGSDRVQAFKLGRPAPKVCCRLFCFSIRISYVAGSSLLLFADRRCRPVHSVCITGTGDGESCGRRPARGGRCSVCSLHQQ
jgi:hypothetical protein